MKKTRDLFPNKWSFKRGQRIIVASLILLSGLAISCGRSGGEIALVQLIDRNGMQETISSNDRLSQLEKVDFLAAQPYQKVTRIFKRDAVGKIHAKLTTYHPSGYLRQYLETVDSRANGVYKEWYPNGKLRMIANVIEGVGDLSVEAQSSWIFDKQSQVWSEDGHLIATIPYDKGQLTDKSLYYNPNGTIAKIIPYNQDKMDGTVELFDLAQNLIGSTVYVNGQKHGPSIFQGNRELPKREEEYEEGKLISGKYWDFKHNLISEVISGRGVKSIYEEGFLRSQEEINGGVLSGLVKIFRENGTLEGCYHISKNLKDGEEWCYYDPKEGDDAPKPMLFLNWKNDEIHGLVQTWYKNGVLESEKEMAHNKKEGLFLAWYEDGSLMMVEEYEKDILQNGKYMKRGEENPISRVVNGKGTATIYDAEGNFVHKIEYQKGYPVE